MTGHMSEWAVLRDLQLGQMSRGLRSSWREGRGSPAPQRLRAQRQLSASPDSLELAGEDGVCVSDLATHDVSHQAIHLPSPQLELPLTPHVTLSRATTPGRPGASRQPSLQRHRASAVLEELGAMAMASEPSGASSWTSVPLPITASRRWKIRPQLLAICSVCTMMLVTGFMMAYQSPANGQHLLSSGERRQNHLLAVGCLLGSLVGAVLLVAGRRRPLLSACVADSVVWLLPIFSSSSWLAYTGEVLTGLVSCAAILVVLVYVAEVSVAECRGGFLVAALASFDAGVLLCLLLAEALSRRHLAVVGLCLLVPTFAALLLLLPESPRYIAACGNKVAAEINLRLLRGLDYYSETELNLVLTNVLDNADAQHAGSWQRTGSWLRAHLQRPSLHALLVAGALAFLVPVCGFSTVASFAVGLLAERGAGSQRLLLVCVALLKLVTTAAGALLVDRGGRRVPLLLSTAVQAAALMLLALCALLLSPTQVYSAAGTAALLLLAALYVAAAGLGMSTVPWLLVAELFPQRSRALGPALCSFTYWTGDLVASWLVLLVQQTLGAAGVLWFHFLGTTAAYIIVFMLVPETRDRALEDIEVYFNSRLVKEIKSRVPSVLITKL